MSAPRSPGASMLLGRYLVVFGLSLPAMILPLVLPGCPDDASEEPSEAAGSGGSARGEAAAEDAPPDDTPDPEVDPLLGAPAFDVRRIRTEPSAARGEDRPCDVAFAEDAQAIEGPAAAHYPEGTASRRIMRCSAPSGGGWVEVAFLDAAAADEVSVGQRIAFRATATTRGRQGYPVVRYLRLVGDSPPAGDTAQSPLPGGEAGAEATANPAVQIAPGFDFGRLRTEAALARRPQRCAVDFVSELVLLDEATRRRGGYPAGTQNRLSVKCLHEGGDSWVDLIFSRDTADLALSVAPGVEFSVQVESVDGGFAGRPMVRLAEAP